MRALLLSFVLLIAGALIFGHQEEQVRTLIGGLLFGAMVGGMCSFSFAWRLGVRAERNAQSEREAYRRGVVTVL